MKFDFLIVGAGLAGSVLAERLASQNNQRVLIIDRRPHIAGNCYDYYDEAGILVHKYGPHAFHTNSKQVFDYLSQFTQWYDYSHKVLASVDGVNIPIPFNFNSIEMLFPSNKSKILIDLLIDKYGIDKKIPIMDLLNSDNESLLSLATYIYNKVFLNYTTKQWGLQPEELDKSVTSRVPVYIGTDNRYFQDVYQAMPLEGYTRMLEKILNHHNINIMLNTDLKSLSSEIEYDKLIYTGALDEYFNYCFGELDYRSLRFELFNLEMEYFQNIGQLNFPNEHKYTRITEFKYLTGQKSNNTTVCYEYPEKYINLHNERYYPIPRPQSEELYKEYEKLTKNEVNVTFLGRLAEYKYYNMDAIILKALHIFNTKFLSK